MVGLYRFTPFRGERASRWYSHSRDFWTFERIGQLFLDFTELQLSNFAYGRYIAVTGQL